MYVDVYIVWSPSYIIVYMYVNGSKMCVYVKVCVAVYF